MSNLAVSQVAWVWLVGGLLLCAGESLAPGIFLLWFGLAAIATGLVMFVLPLPLEWSLIVFGLFAIVTLLIGRRTYGSRNREGDRPFLNRRAEALIGQIFVLDQPIEAGEGRIRVNDSIWRIVGPDLPIGTRVRVTEIIEGGLLRVEAA